MAHLHKVEHASLNFQILSIYSLVDDKNEPVSARESGQLCKNPISSHFIPFLMSFHLSFDKTCQYWLIREYVPDPGITESFVRFAYRHSFMFSCCASPLFFCLLSFKPTNWTLGRGYFCKHKTFSVQTLRSMATQRRNWNYEICLKFWDARFWSESLPIPIHQHVLIRSYACSHKVV